jgi:hypothetical protein
MSVGACVVLLVGAAARAEKKQKPQWARLGSITLGAANERQEVENGDVDVRYKSIRLRAQDAGALVTRIVVVFKNGDKTERDKNFELAAGGESDPLDLGDDARHVRKVIVQGRSLYKGESSQIIVYGLEAEKQKN